MIERPRDDTPEKITDSDKERILDNLFRLRDELEIFIDVEEGDVKSILGEDDTDFLTNLTTIALMNGFDPDDFFELLDKPAKFREPPEEKPRSTMIVEGTLGSKALEQLEKAPEQE